MNPARQTKQDDHAANGITVVYNRETTYNAAGRAISDTSYSIKTDGKSYQSSTTYFHGSGASYALGQVVSQSTGNNGTSDLSSSASIARDQVSVSRKSSRA